MQGAELTPIYHAILHMILQDCSKICKQEACGNLFWGILCTRQPNSYETTLDLMVELLNIPALAAAK